MASTADSLVFITDTEYATIQVFALFNLFCGAIYSAYKRRSLDQGHEQTQGSRNVVTYTWVSGHTHRRIFADLKLKLISELQSEIFVDVIKSLQNTTSIMVDSNVLLNGMTHQFIFDPGLGRTTPTPEDKLPRRKKCSRVDREGWS